MIVNTEFSEAVVESLHDVTPTVRELRIRPIAHKPVPHDPGAHLQVQILVAGVLGQPQVQTRHYSLVGEPDGEHYRIAVKRQDDGRGGSLAMWRLAAGDRLVVSAPQNHFPLDTRAPDYLLVAGGIGITPMVMMAQRLAARGAPVRMIYSARSAAELAFAEELKPVLGDRLGLHAGDRGEHADLAAAIDGLADGGLLYTCGPVPMLDAIKLAWSRAGRPQQDLRFETFGSGGSHAAQEFAVHVPRHGLQITVPVGSSLLETLEHHGIEAVSDCRRGECGLCTLDVLSLDGEIDHRDVFLSDEEKHSNTRICACVSRVVGSITLDTSYRPDTLPTHA